MDPIPDPILPEKFLGYSRESNPGPLGWRSDVLTTIPERWSSQIRKAKSSLQATLMKIFNKEKFSREEVSCSTSSSYSVNWSRCTKLKWAATNGSNLHVFQISTLAYHAVKYHVSYASTDSTAKLFLAHMNQTWNTNQMNGSILVLLVQRKCTLYNVLWRWCSLWHMTLKG